MFVDYHIKNCVLTEQQSTPLKAEMRSQDGLSTDLSTKLLRRFGERPVVSEHVTKIIEKIKWQMTWHNLRL